MTMTIDNQQRHHIGSMGLDHMPYSAGPQFSNPWATSSASTSSSQMYPTAFGSYGIGKQEPARSSSMSMPYSSLPATTASYSSQAYTQPELVSSTQSSQAYDQSYTAAPSQNSSYATQAGTFPPINSYTQSLSQQPEQARAPTGAPPPTAAFGEALDGARGMVAMSQTDITPRNIYGPRGDRGSTDSYGFPSSHSSHSSISSASSGYPNYFGGSVDSSATDYSSAAESIDGMNSRTLPRPNGLMGANLPPAPQSMMGSFNSKVSSSAQKKHKCKVCDKRFTRPSSLQTHMYSHTGEKPFACEVSGCGRRFSVVSNLRRHRKVHKDSRSIDGEDQGSPEGSWASSTRD